MEYFHSVIAEAACWALMASFLVFGAFIAVALISAYASIAIPALGAILSFVALSPLVGALYGALVAE